METEAGNEAGDDDDVGDLFGSDDDDDDDDGAGALAAAAAQPSAEPISFELPRRPRPEEGASLFLARLPNILKVQPRPFDAETYNEKEDYGVKGFAGAGAANVMRWRNTESGEMQSNTRLVKWSDGSMTLHVGGEALKCQQVSMVEGSTHLYAATGSSLECHGTLPHISPHLPISPHISPLPRVSWYATNRHTYTHTHEQALTPTHATNPHTDTHTHELALTPTRELPYALTMHARHSRAHTSSSM